MPPSGTDSAITSLSDEALMARIGQADRTAFSVLVNRHLGRAVGLATRLLGNKAQAEDVVQEVMTKVWIHAPKWVDPEAGDKKRAAKFTTWFYRVLRNAVIDRQRKKKPQQLVDEPIIEDQTKSVVSALVSAETSAEVRRVVEGLPDKQRLALIYCFFEGMSNAEAAELMGTTVKAIESLLVRARRSLREDLADLYTATLEDQ